ncbi:MAG: sigma-70 family RNA polymerase sigma factor [Ruminococcus sp.]|nr:sigma-70 family RNA polymerase sigma factor [Ruminococcus sp.]
MNIGTEHNFTSKEQIEETIRNYSGLVFRTAYQYLKNYHDAQDLTQDVFVALVTGKPEFENNKKLRNWLITVTLNKCSDLYKSSWRKRTEPLNDEIAINEPETYEMMTELWKLPENYRTVLYLHYYMDMTVDEIAAVLGKSRNTVGSWLTRGRKKLKKILTEGGTYNA